MHLHLKLITTTFLLFFVLLTSLHASAVEWKDLKPFEQFLLSEHKSSWSEYADSKKSFLKGSAEKKAKKIDKYRKWEKKNLSKKEQHQLRVQFKKLSDKQFKGYMDKLFKKYGPA